MPKKEPAPNPQPDSLDKLAEFTKQILRVSRSEIYNKPDSTGTQTDKPRQA